MGKKMVSLAAAAASAVACLPAPAAAQATDPFLGQLMLVPYNFCPRGWAEAGGQLLAISQNQALFALLGTQYGGDGQTTFALPDLRSRFVMGQGQGPGLSPYSMGEQGGTETRTLTTSQMPAHTHTALIRANPVAADTGVPVRNSFAISPDAAYTTQGSGANYMKSTTVDVQPAGGSQPFSTMPPYTTLRWCIALQGVFPSRN